MENGFITCMNKGFRLTFENGLTISVQWGPGNYCSNKGDEFDAPQNKLHYSCGTAEIAIMSDNCENSSEWVVFKGGDNLCGWLSADQVADYITKVKNAKSLRELDEDISFMERYKQENEEAE